MSHFHALVWNEGFDIGGIISGKVIICSPSELYDEVKERRAKYCWSLDGKEGLKLLGPTMSIGEGIHDITSINLNENDLWMSGIMMTV